MLVSWSSGQASRPCAPQVVDLLGGCRGRMKSSTSARYVRLYLTLAIATVYIMLGTVVGALRTAVFAAPFLSKRRRLPERRVEVIVKCEDSMHKYLISASGETLIATRAARLSRSSNFRLVTLDDNGEGELPALIIRIRISEDGKPMSKLIFTSPVKPGTLRLFRRFGTDRVPIKPTENINVLTDTVQVGRSHFISFNDTKII